MDAGVFFVVHVWCDARGFHATARDVMSEHADEFDDPDALALVDVEPPADEPDDFQVILVGLAAHGQAEDFQRELIDG